MFQARIVTFLQKFLLFLYNQVSYQNKIHHELRRILCFFVIVFFIVHRQGLLVGDFLLFFQYKKSDWFLRMSFFLALIRQSNGIFEFSCVHIKPFIIFNKYCVRKSGFGYLHDSFFFRVDFKTC